MPGFARIGAAFAATAMLLVPAFWNGFPLLQYDTGGYLARWFEHTLAPNRSTVYGLLLTAFANLEFWPVVVLQAASTVWVLALMLRVHDVGERPVFLIGVTALLTVTTALPWIASILLTDVFTGVAVLAMYLLVHHGRALKSSERRALVVLMAFAAATHSATLAVLMILAIAASVARVWIPSLTLSGVARGAGALLLGATMLLCANYLTASRFAWTPGGDAVAFGRMLQDGIVKRYLAEHCPDKRLRLCAHRHELPQDADMFFWGGSVFDRLGRFDGLRDEMRTIAIESLHEYPAMQAEAALVAVARQLVAVGNGEGVLNTIWHTYYAIERYAPSAVAHMRAARQQRGEIGFGAINRIEVPVALLSMALLIPIAAFGRGRAFADLRPLAVTAGAALLANAFVCGVLANPHDRYGARLAWIAPLVVLLAIYRLCERARYRPAAVRHPVPHDPRAAASPPVR